MLRRSAICILLLAVAVFACHPARAADDSNALNPHASGWQLSMTPYVWSIFITGEQSVGNITSDIDTNLFEIIDDASELYAFMSDMEFRKGKLGIRTDVFWAKIRVPAERSLTGEIPTLPILPNLRFSATAQGGLTVNMALVDSGVAYEFAKRSSGASAKDPVAMYRSTAVDFLAGARYWYLRPEFNFNVTGTISVPALGLSRTGAGRVSGAKTIDWWDPYVGLRLRQQRGPGKELVLQGDVGGFGVGSDFTWKVQGLYNFDTTLLGHDITAQLGYRALYADYEQGSGRNRVGFDWLWHGPIMGLKMSF